jgi:tripeptide aminopeptidase
MNSDSRSDFRAPIQAERLLERFLQYVRIDTASNPHVDDCPSSPGQRQLGLLLVDQLRDMRLETAIQDEHGMVWATIPASLPGDGLPTVLLNSHLDTSPEASGRDVQPQVIESYGGGPIRLGASGLAIDPADSPELRDLHGKTLITTDGTTLLGGDDKAGVAILMELAHHLIERPYLPHGPIQLLFTCDEEIGRGTRYVDRQRLTATVGYTLDGGGAGVIDHETFSADGAVVQFLGKNIHPSIAKGRMVNALRAAGVYLALLPRDHLSPESTEARQGFVHPYQLQGSVAEATLHLILRDFQTDKLEDHAMLLRRIAQEVEQQVAGIRISIDIRHQYRNMADGLRRLPLAVGLAQQAFELLGRSPRLESIRGGTDGALLTELGLPTPNLSAGQYNIHSPLEFACLDHMVAAVEHLVVLVDLWQLHGRS